MAERKRRVRVEPRRSNADDLPSRGWRRLLVLIGRAFTRRCPYCGVRGVFSSWWTLRPECPRCGVTFEREEGYFLGTYAVNLIVAEFAAVALIVALLVFADLELLPLELIALTLAVGLPIAFYPIATGLWMALDLMLHPPRYPPRYPPPGPSSRR